VLRDGLAAQLAQAEEAQSAARAEQPYLDFWIRGYSPVGLKAALLAEMIPELNPRAAHYSELLTAGEVRVRFLGNTTLKSGEQRDKFDVVCEVTGAAGSYTQCSDGQRRRGDLITTLALNDRTQARLSSPIDLLIMDELFDGLDEVGIEYVMELLRELARTRGSIFCITHRVDLAAWFPTVHQLVYEDYATRLVA